MKNYKEITLRYLKTQKKRTLLTIFGIILSVSLITAISTLILSVRDGMILDEIKTEGSFHGIVEGIDYEKVDKLSKHVDVFKSGVKRRVGFAPISDTTEREINNYNIDIPYRYLDIAEYDEDALNMIPVNLKEGRLPKKSNELVIENIALTYLDKNLKLGDKVNLAYGERVEKGEDENERKIEGYEEKGSSEYTIVGIMEPKYYWGGELITRGISGYEGEGYGTEDYSVYLQVENIKNANDRLNNIISDVGGEENSLRYNDRLLRLSAEGLSDTFNEAIMGLVIFIFLIIIVSTIAVIYNAFNISVIERIEQFGLLRSIGATPKQIKFLVYREAGILSVIGIPLGIIAGVFAMKVVLYIIGVLGFKFQGFNSVVINVYPQVIILSVILGIITVFLSAKGPAKQASKISPLDAIRSSGNIVKEDISKVKSSRIIRRIFGIEGEIAYKNLARNKKRFFITVFSMIISIVLFITFSTFSDMSFMITDKHSKDMGDLRIYGDFDDEDKIVEELMGSDDIEYVYNFKNSGGSLILEDGKMDRKLREDYYNKNDILNIENGKEVVHGVEINSIGDASLSSLDSKLKSGTTRLKDKKNAVLVVNSSSYYDEASKEFVFVKDAFKYKPGDRLKVKAYNGSDEEIYRDLEVVGVLDKGILNNQYNSNASINIITSDELMKDMQGEDEQVYKNIYLKIKDGKEKKNVTKLIDEYINKDPRIQLIDYEEVANEERQNATVASIFLYGFVTIISIISIINIINTINTNIILRTKEIGTVRAIGMSKRNIKKMISLESVYYGIIASFIGSILGSILSFILFRILIDLSSFSYIYPVKNILIACIGTIIISILSGLYPLRKINNKIIVESIKEEN